MSMVLLGQVPHAQAQTASFRSVDTNSDRALSRDELIAAFGAAGAARLLDTHDGNGDDRLTIRELRNGKSTRRNTQDAEDSEDEDDDERDDEDRDDGDFDGPDGEGDGGDGEGDGEGDGDGGDGDGGDGDGGDGDGDGGDGDGGDGGDD